MKGMRKVSRGKGFRGVLSYGIERDNKRVGLVIGGNLDGQSPGELAAQFLAARRLRPEIGKPVWHQALRLPAGEKISNERWAEIADDYMRRMGFGALHQRVYILHDDEDGQHIHIVANRISLDGQVFLGQNENLQSTTIVRQLEKDFCLRITQEREQETKPTPRKPSPKEASAAEEMGVRPARVRLQKLVDQALDQAKSASSFVASLEMKGVGVRANLASTGRLNGFSFRLDGVDFKGSDLGKTYTMKGLAERGLSYDYLRDAEMLRAASKCAETVAPPKQLPIENISYQEWKTERIEGNRKAYQGILAQRAQAIKEIREQGGTERKRIRAAHLGRTAGDRAAKALALSNQRMAQVLAEANAREVAIRAIEHHKRNRPPIGYRDYLADVAQAGSAKALDQLRQTPITKGEGPIAGNQIRQAPVVRSITVLMTQEWMTTRRITSMVNRKTTAVSYYRDGQLLFVDQRHAIVTNREDRETLQLQLALAMRKFGNAALRLDGSEQFIEQIILLAASDRQFAFAKFEDKTQQARLERLRQQHTDAKARRPVVKARFPFYR